MVNLDTKQNRVLFVSLSSIPHLTFEDSSVYFGLNSHSLGLFKIHKTDLQLKLVSD